MQDARWFKRDVVKAAMETRSSISRHEAQKFDAGSENVEANKINDELRLPPQTAIAAQLIKSWVEGTV